MHRTGGIWLAAILAVILIGFLGYRVTNYVIKGPNQQYYQRTKADRRGKIDRSIYSQSELRQLTVLTHGSRYSGNTSLDTAATQHVYQLNGHNLPNIVGADGVLKLYSKSTFMTPAMVRDAAEYWNKLAGKQIVVIVNKQYQSDEVIHDGQNNQHVLGGQTYNGQGIKFYPANWQISDLSAKNQQNWKEAALIHEIGHALGIPHLGGGLLGSNAANAGIAITDFMGPWAVGGTHTPAQNEYGVRSTAVDAAALALAGASWQKPRRLASWVLTSPTRAVIYNHGRITSTIP